MLGASSHPRRPPPHISYTSSVVSERPLACGWSSPFFISWLLVFLWLIAGTPFLYRTGAAITFRITYAINMKIGQIWFFPFSINTSITMLWMRKESFRKKHLTKIEIPYFNINILTGQKNVRNSRRGICLLVINWSMLLQGVSLSITVE